MVGWFDNDDGGIHRVHDIAFGVLFGLLLAVAFFALMHRPKTKPSALFQVLAVALAALMAGVASRNLSYLQIALFVAVAAGVLFLLHPARGVLAHPSPSPSVAMMVFVLAASFPLVWFGLSAASLQRNGIDG